MKTYSLLTLLLLLPLQLLAQQTGVLKDARDGKSYTTVKIGSQWWMAENLNYKTSSSYNTRRTGYYTLSDAKRSCPKGWRLPSDEDWKKLEVTTGMSHKDAGRSGYRGSTAEKLKKGGSLGLNITLSGKYVPRSLSERKVKDVGYIGLYWTSDYYTRGFTNSRYGSSKIARDAADNGSSYYCVRCMKDAENLTGEEKAVELKTLGGSVSDIEGNKYRTVRIGNQTWMAENLKTTKNKDGRSITYYKPTRYEKDLEVYGYLYTWEVAQDVCPSGWHLPAVDEWNEMINELGGFAVAGGKLKEKGNDHWTSPNEGATNESGFSGVAAGVRHPNNGQINYHRDRGYYWSATEDTDTDACYFQLHYNQKSMSDKQFCNGKGGGQSVRCIKDK